MTGPKRKSEFVSPRPSLNVPRGETEGKISTKKMETKFVCSQEKIIVTVTKRANRKVVDINCLAFSFCLE